MEGGEGGQETGERAGGRAGRTEEEGEEGRGEGGQGELQGDREILPQVPAICLSPSSSLSMEKGECTRRADRKEGQNLEGGQER